MGETIQLTDEQLRILRAARDGRLRTGLRDLWLIECDEERPMSHERLRLRDIGLLRFSWHVDGYYVGLLTDAGREALEASL